MNMNNLAGPLVYYYDVGNFNATIFKYTRVLHVFATTCMVQPSIIRNGIGYTLIRLQGSLAIATILAQWHTYQPHTIPLGAATLAAYSSSRVNTTVCQDELLLGPYTGTKMVAVLVFSDSSSNANRAHDEEMHM